MAACLALAACDAGGLPDAASPDYTEAVRAFHTGIVAVQAGHNEVAAAAFERVTEIAPGEPAAWADLGLVALLRNEPDRAAEALAEARDLATDAAAIELISGLAAAQRGDEAAAEAHYRRAVELDSVGVRPLFLLARHVEDTGRAEGVTKARRLIDRAVERAPANRALLLERARLAAKAGDADALTAAARDLASSPDLPSAATARLAVLEPSAAGGALRDAAGQIALLETELAAVPVYRQDRDAVELSPGRTELLVTRFIRLPAPSARPAAADTTLRFEPRPLAVGDGPTGAVRVLWIDEEPEPLVAAARPGAVWLGSETGPEQVVRMPGSDEMPAALEPIDYDYDFRLDLAVAGPAGLRLLRNAEGTFTDVTATALPPEAAGAFSGVWAVDLDLEGDVDLVAARVEGPPLVLRNNGDGRFVAIDELGEAGSLRAFAWADLDADGDPDAVTLDDAGRLRVFLNERRDPRRFELLEPAYEGAPLVALAAADLDGDARLEVVVLDRTGALSRLELTTGGWEAERLGEWAAASSTEAGSVLLFVEDLDNNGQLDVLATAPVGTRVWLGTGDGLVPHRTLDARVTDVADLSGEGLLDLVALAPDGSPQWLDAQADLEYFATTLRPRAAGSIGDRRINTFGIGGEIEVRAGLLYQKQPIRGSTVHFGLGDWAQADVARILWPNGTVQAEFNISGRSASTVARQRLKGSCPWVFTWDGTGMRFITDFLWRTSLGLRINAQGDVAVMHGEDWVRIPGDALAPRDGVYDVRITAELWETHFFDHVSLLAVDHPDGTEVWVDERFTLPPPTPTLHTTGPLRPLAGARDHHGRDAGDRVTALDGVYLDTFERSDYQGIVEPHFVEIELPADAPAAGPLWLVASGWVYPTDTSINVAMAQRGDPRPRGLRVEAADGAAAGWSSIRTGGSRPARRRRS